MRIKNIGESSPRRPIIISEKKKEELRKAVLEITGKLGKEFKNDKLPSEGHNPSILIEKKYIKDRGEINLDLQKCINLATNIDTDRYGKYTSLINKLKNPVLKERELDEMMLDEKIAVSESDDFVAIYNNKDELLNYYKSRKNIIEKLDEEKKNGLIIEAKREVIEMALSKRIIHEIIAQLAQLYLRDPSQKERVKEAREIYDEIINSPLYRLNQEILDRNKKNRIR